MRALVLAVLLLALAPPARAIVVDGQLDPGYTPLAVQSTQTSPTPDATSGLLDFTNGSELDGAYAAIDQGVLYLFFAGNLKDAICGTQACTDADMLEVFLDTQPGGQNVLLDVGATDFPAPGLTFDAGFSPDYVLNFYPGGALDNSFSRWAWFGTLPTGGGGSAVLLGSGSNAGAPGTLTGGTNPYGIEATIDNRNTGGVGAGCAAASGAGVTTGVELAIPLAAVGSPTGCIGVCALVYDPQASHGLTNQALPSVPAGTCALGAPATTNLAAIAGAQNVTLCPSAVPVRTPTWGRLKSIYR